jgi:hypothetical protein
MRSYGLAPSGVCEASDAMMRVTVRARGLGASHRQRGRQQHRLFAITLEDGLRSTTTW